jgi:membrane-bound metal-dependent hydrolase YbcI (DUF457 family)
MALWDQFAAIKYHRSLTHSVFGGLLLALVVAWPIYRWGAHKRYWDLVGLVYLGILLHIGLDIITPFGTKVLYPLSSTPFSWELAFVIDPLLTMAFAVPLLVAWWRPRLASRAVGIGLMAAIVYLGLAAGAREMTRMGFASELRQREIAADRVEVIPRLFSPFLWRAVAVGSGRFYYAEAIPWSGAPLDLRLYSQALRNGYVERSDALESVQLFRAFARFPWTRYLRRGEEHIVEYRDLTFGGDRTVHDMVLRVVMDASGRVKSVDFNHRF